jgi:hypothetical protein
MELVEEPESRDRNGCVADSLHVYEHRQQRLLAIPPRESVGDYVGPAWTKFDAEIIAK